MIESDFFELLKAALKSGDKPKVSTVRLIICELKNKKIELGKKELDPNEVVQVITKMAKQRKESIEKFSEAGRDDLVQKETLEFDILNEFLPEEMSLEDLVATIESSIAELGASGPKDMGVVMKAVLAKTNGRADGKEISRIVKEKLT